MFDLPALSVIPDAMALNAAFDACLPLFLRAWLGFAAIGALVLVPLALLVDGQPTARAPRPSLLIGLLEAREVYGAMATEFGLVLLAIGPAARALATLTVHVTLGLRPGF